MMETWEIEPRIKDLERRAEEHEKTLNRCMSLILSERLRRGDLRKTGATEGKESTDSAGRAGSRPEHTRGVHKDRCSKPMKYRRLKGYKYDLREDERVDVEIYEQARNDFLSLDHGQLIIKKGYAWDGASGPTIDDKTNMTASLVHDALYQLMREGLIERSRRKYVDKLFRDICLKNGMSKFRAWYYYRAVRMFGKDSSFARKHPRGKIIEV